MLKLQGILKSHGRADSSGANVEVKIVSKCQKTRDYRYIGALRNGANTLIINDLSGKMPKKEAK